MNVVNPARFAPGVGGNAVNRGAVQRHDPAWFEASPIGDVSMYAVARELSFCYGHRLLDYDGKCARLHGHNARVVLHLATAELDRLGMVADFMTIRDRIGAWIDSQLDHRMILHVADPALPALRDLGEPVHVVEFNPTAENLARLIFEHAHDQGLPVVEVELWETPTCKATYRP